MSGSLHRLSIRRANLSDSRKVAELAERTFRDTFEAVNTAEDIDQHCRKSYSESIQTAEISNPNMITLLSEIDGDLVGFSHLRWTEPPACVAAEAPGEIHRFYIVAEHHGKGIAGELMTASLAEMKSHGSDVVWLGVWERNPRAMAFYKKSGFVEVGDHIFQLGSDPQRDIVMARAVTG